MADANRGQPEDTAVAFRLGLHLRDASDAGVARRPDERTAEDARRGGIVVSAGLRDAVAGRVRASFAELGSAGLGTVEQPIHAYEVGWDPADWPAESAKAATAIAPSDAGKRKGRLARSREACWRRSWSGLPRHTGRRRLSSGVACRARKASNPCSSSGAPRPPSCTGCSRRARRRGQDEPTTSRRNPNAPPADAYDGLYAGTGTTRADSHVVTFKVKVTNGIGSGTQSRLDCGTAPVALKISRLGQVSGMALIFGSTCLKTELAIRGRAVAGTLRLMLGSQFVELSAAD
jgi:hypothetical protein